MLNSKEIAIEFCKIRGIDPFLRTVGCRPETIAIFPNGYELWEYWEFFYIIPIYQLTLEQNNI